MVKFLRKAPVLSLLICLVIASAPLITAALFPVRVTYATDFTVEAPSIDETVNSLLNASDRVVRGRVTGQTSFWNADRSAILTDNQVTVYYDVVGSGPSTIIVRTLGGELPDEDIAMGATHAPQLGSREETLLYLSKAGEQYAISRGEAGKFTVVGDQALNERTGTAVPLEKLLQATAAAADQQARAVTLPQDWQTVEAQNALSSAGVNEVDNYAYSGIHWPGNNPVVDFYLNPVSAQSGPGDGDQNDFTNAILNGGVTWNNVATAAFTFRYAGSTNQQDVGRNGVNEAMFIDQGTSNSVLGQTRYWYSTSNKEIVEVDVWFNDAYDFDATGSPGPGEIDLQSVATHEFGHWLSLGHDDNSAAIMYYSISAGTVKRNLYQTDIEGISAIYPCPDGSCGAGPTPTSTFTPTPTFTSTPTFTPTSSPTFTPTVTPTPPDTPPATFTPTWTPSPTATATPDGTPSPTATPGGTIPPTPTATPTEIAQVREVSSNGGRVIFYNDGDSTTTLTLDIPPGAVDGSVALAYAPISDAPLPPGPSDQFAGVRFELNAAQDGAPVDSFQFNAPVTFVLTYLEQEGIGEENLTLFYFDEATQGWRPAACGDTRRNPSNNEVSTEVCHLTEFALFSHPADARVFLPLVTR